MFNSLTNRRRRTARAFRPQLGRGLRRPLGFEAMEGRWLLSAMSLDVTTLSLPVTPLAVHVGQFTAFAGQSPQFNIGSEGGFIPLGNLQANATSSRTIVLSDVVVSSAASPLTPGGLVLNNANSNEYSFGVDSASGFDLRPAVIVPSDHGAVLRPNTDTIVAGDSWTETGGQEGGSINVKSILKGDERGGGFGSDKRVALFIPENLPDPSAASEPSERTAAGDLAGLMDSPASAAPLSFSAAASARIEVTLGNSSAIRTASSIGTGISGEWARAVVFEMAGGEPAWALPPSVTSQARPSSTPDRPDSARTAAPLPPSAMGQQAVHRTGGRHQIAADEIELGVSVSRLTGSSGAVRPADSLPSSEQEFGAPATGLAAFNVPDAAYAEVFAQFGRSDKAVARASADEDSQSMPIAAAPLLAFVVLERVAARYWSRMNKEASTVLAGPARL
ncbi:MAG: hypothetical protein WD894_07850 [Pirellulales bacterium]